MDNQKLSRGATAACCMCGAVSNNKNYTVFGIQFFELEGEPRICSKCIFEKLTGGKRVDWNLQHKQFITQDKK